MSEVKKIIINGNEYTVSDGGAVAFDTAQVLTDEQKAQARKNIGAAPMIVTVTDDVASHTSEQIYSHVQAGGTAVLDDEGYTYVLVGCTADYASFDHSYDDGLLDNILIYGDGSVEKREYAKLGSGTLSNYIPRPSTAEVGQTIVVKAVDDKGAPVAWEAADLPTPKDGEDGVSVTHSWDGTVLTITSASGTSSADLKGEKGDTGAQGVQGIQGEKGDKGDTGDPGLTWRGEWSDSITDYIDGDVVYHNGSAYVFDNESNPESEPGVEDSVWSLLAAKGDTGATGPAYTLTDTDKATIASAVKASLTTESWTFTLEDGSAVTKAVYVG